MASRWRPASKNRMTVVCVGCSYLQYSAPDSKRQHELGRPSTRIRTLDRSNSYQQKAGFGGRIAFIAYAKLPMKNAKGTRWDFSNNCFASDVWKIYWRRRIACIGFSIRDSLRSLGSAPLLAPAFLCWWGRLPKRRPDRRSLYPSCSPGCCACWPRYAMPSSPAWHRSRDRPTPTATALWESSSLGLLLGIWCWSTQLPRRPWLMVGAITSRISCSLSIRTSLFH